MNCLRSKNHMLNYYPSIISSSVNKYVEIWGMFIRFAVQICMQYERLQKPGSWTGQANLPTSTNGQDKQ